MFLQTRVQDVFAAYDLTIISTDEDEVFYLGEYYTDGTSAPVPVPDQDHPRDVTAGSSWGPRTSGSVRLGEMIGNLMSLGPTRVTLQVKITVSQNTSLTIVYSTVCSGADKENIKVPRHWPL